MSPPAVPSAAWHLVAPISMPMKSSRMQELPRHGQAPLTMTRLVDPVPRRVAPAAIMLRASL